MKECPVCHAKIEENARFCIHCMTGFEEKRAIPPLSRNLKGIPIIFTALSLVLVSAAVGVAFLAKEGPENLPSGNGNRGVSGNRNSGTVSQPLTPHPFSNPTTEDSISPTEVFSSVDGEKFSGGTLSNLSGSDDIQRDTNTQTDTPTTQISRPTNTQTDSSTGPLQSTNTQTSRPSTGNSQNTATPPDTPEPKEEISYIFDEDTGTLTLTGTGAMEDYNYSNFLADASPWHMYRKSIKKVVLSEGITTIGRYAFFDCSALTEISIPQSVTTICISAFRSCTGLTECTIPDSIITIEGAAFADCTGLTEISLPKSVTSIASFAFEGCYNVTKVNISAENSTYYAVNNCIIEGATKTLVSGFKNSIIPDDGSVTKIGDHAFYDMATRTEITLPNGITSIGKMAFNRCSELTEITLPESLTEIETNAFLGCTELKTVYNKSSLPIVKGSTNYGHVAYYAENVYD